jgi:hypothetical protein
MTTKQLYQGIKVSLCSAVLLVTFSTAKAQEAAFDKGSKTLGLALGIGDGEDAYDNYGGDHTALPAFAITYDQGIVGDVGPGTIGVGGIVSGKESYENYGDNGKVTWSSFLIGVRGDYHLTILKDKNNKFDPYAGVTIGARFNHYHDNGDGGQEYTSNTSDPIFAPFIGAKYNFAEHVGVFAEASFDISLLRGGICFNF